MSSGIIGMQCLSRYGVTSEAEGLSQLNFHIGFYMPLSDLRVPQVRPRDCLNSISALGFTRL